MFYSLFICPICQSPLQPATNMWRCNGRLHPKQTIHTFDVARQGYVNLLPVQQKKSKSPGDSLQSIKARQRFLAAGYYQPLQVSIVEQMQKLLAFRDRNTHIVNDDNEGGTNWLDIGCGEGYYTQAMVNTGMLNLIAADISKPALVELARVSKAANHLWFQQDNNDKGNINRTAIIYPLVTSAAHLPLSLNSLTGISSIFSPILPEIFAKILQNDGYLIIAKPDVGHLMSVRQALFDDVREHDSDKFLPSLTPHFQLLSTHYVTANLSLCAESLADLLTMTPYAYRAHSEKRQTLLAMTECAPFITEAKFVVYVLQKTSAR